MKKLIKETIVKHKRIVFNGDGYTDAWVEEAKSRGLLNLKSTPEALPYMEAEKNIELFVKHGIFTAAEVRSRVEIMLEKYAKTINIEALTMLDMLYKDICRRQRLILMTCWAMLRPKRTWGSKTALKLIWRRRFPS